MSSLPEEMYLDILLRVPVKSTFVCKCVCKSWFQIISNRDFVKSHLNLTTQRTNNHSLLIQSTKMYLKFDSLSSSNDADDAVIVRLDPPYRNTKLLGSCDGIVYGWNCMLDFYFLWNPATREYKELPQSPDECYMCKGGNYGFGYDYKTDDYKLVKFDIRNGSTLVVVYSLESNSWKTFLSIQYNFPYVGIAGVHFNGTLHWFGNTIGKTSSTVIVTIDFRKERFEEMQLSMTLPLDQSCMDIGVLEDCLCVLAKSKGTYDVWVMSDYGVPESWSKLYSIMFESIIGFRGCYLDLIGSFWNGEILFRTADDIFSYNSKLGTGRKTEIDYLHKGGAVKYFESLVSLSSKSVVERKRKSDIAYVLMKTKMLSRRLRKSNWY